MPCGPFSFTTPNQCAPGPAVFPPPGGEFPTATATITAAAQARFPISQQFTLNFDNLPQFGHGAPYRCPSVNTGDRRGKTLGQP